jgi:ketosteroid isomerase-like protein
MRSDAEGILEAGLGAYAMGDLEVASAYFAEDAVYAIHIDQQILPFGGEVIGRNAILHQWQEINRAFELVQHNPKIISCNDDVVRVQVQFAFRHRRSGAVIDGMLRIVAQVEGGKIVRLREYHDQERIRAFMCLFEQDARDGKATPQSPA